MTKHEGRARPREIFFALPSLPLKEAPVRLGPAVSGKGFGW